MKRYKEGERIFKVSFDIPMDELEAESIAKKIFEMFADATNVRALKSTIRVREPQTYFDTEFDGYSVWKSKYCGHIEDEKDQEPEKKGE